MSLGALLRISGVGGGGIYATGSTAEPEPRVTHSFSCDNNIVDMTMFLHALSVAPFHVSEIFDDAYWMCSTLLQEIVNEHAPIKQKTIKGNHIPYMNGEIRRAIDVKRMLKRKFTKCNNNMNWDKYRKQRNIVTKLLKKSLQQYMHNKMQRGC